ncbi:MAG: hypothetical protein CMJ75_02800, partial [Planctomycetaceae bacterium]|nr:hypothetical protein [Planctomycetaceae bacterium]
ELQDLTGYIAREKEAVQNVGGQISFIGEVVYSSTSLLNQYFSILTPQTESYLSKLRETYNVEFILEQIELFKKKKVLVVRETIIDEYIFCQPLGIANKATCVNAQYKDTELHLGGAAGIVKHLDEFCKEVSFVTSMDLEGEYPSFVKKKLGPNIQTKFFTLSQSYVVKKRFLTLGNQQNNQIFEMTHTNSNQTTTDTNTEQSIFKYLEQVSQNYDLIIVADYGYNFINAKLAKFLCQLDNYLSVSAQTNSYNLGSNLLTKYSKADYICADEPEIRLALGMASANTKDLIPQLSKKLNCPKISITLGDQGSFNWSQKNGFFKSTAFTTEVVDATGASSAYFGVSSLCAHSELEPRLIGFIGNCVGAMMVRTLGHRQYVSPNTLSRFVTALLK